jgi:hypothetical protein
VDDAGYNFESVDVVVVDLKIDKSQLTSRRVVLESIRSGEVTADVTQASVDAVTKLPITLGAGTVSLAGIEVTPNVSVAGQTVTLSAAGLPPVSVTIPELSLVPCVGAAVILPGVLQLSCTIHALPKALANFSESF